MARCLVPPGPIHWRWLCWFSLFERPMYLYEVAQTLRSRGKQDSVRLNYGSLYSVVESLERRGLIQATETVRDGRRPERTVYKLTGAGATEVNEWLSELVSVPVKEFPQFMAALSFLGALPPEEGGGGAPATGVGAGDPPGPEPGWGKLAAAIGLARLFWLESEYEDRLLEAEVGFRAGQLIDDIDNGSLEGIELLAFAELESIDDTGGEAAPKRSRRLGAACWRTRLRTDEPEVDSTGTSLGLQPQRRAPGKKPASSCQHGEEETSMTCPRLRPAVSPNVSIHHRPGRAGSRRCHPGRIVAILGPNGAGKTTLVRTVADPGSARRWHPPGRRPERGGRPHGGAPHDRTGRPVSGRRGDDDRPGEPDQRWPGSTAGPGDRPAASSTAAGPARPVGVRGPAGPHLLRRDAPPA